MPKYLFSNDQRISVLAERIQWVAKYVKSGKKLKDISGKSDNNNAATLEFYYNLYPDTMNTEVAVTSPQEVIRNFVLKFQFPNTRTPESFNDSVIEGVYLAPYRMVVSILVSLAKLSKTNTAYLSLDEILYYVFTDCDVCKNPSIDCDKLATVIVSDRNNHRDFSSIISANLEWKHYDRQVREMIAVLSKCCDCFQLSKGVLLYTYHETDEKFISELVSYPYFWTPTNENDFELSNKEYISYMNIAETPYNVVKFPKKNNIGEKEISNPVPPTSDSIELDTRDYAYMAAIKTKPFLIIGGFSGTGKSLMVKSLAFGCCPCDGELNTSKTSPGNYLLVSVKPNWHDATDITGFRSSVNRNYYVTDFMRFLVKAKLHPEVPFFVCLDEMNLAPVEEYFADFLSVIESRKRKEDGTIVTDAIVPASVFDDKDYADDFNIFLKLGLKPVNEVKDVADFTAQIKEDGNDEAEYFQESWLVDELRRDGLTIPQNVIIIGTVNMDDTTNSFSRKVIDRAMTFETIVSEFDTSYFDADVALCYFKHPRKGELFISDEVRATDMIDNHRFELSDEDKQRVIGFINDINADLEGTPFKISYRILNETILLYRAKQEIAKLMDKEGGFEDNVTFNTDLNAVFDDILMQKVLPRIEGDYEKCDKCLVLLAARAEANNWMQSAEKIEFMIKRFGKDKSGFTTFWN